MKKKKNVYSLGITLQSTVVKVHYIKKLITKFMNNDQNLGFENFCSEKMKD